MNKLKTFITIAALLPALATAGDMNPNTFYLTTQYMSDNAVACKYYLQLTNRIDSEPCEQLVRGLPFLSDAANWALEGNNAQLVADDLTDDSLAKLKRYSDAYYESMFYIVEHLD